MPWYTDEQSALVRDLEFSHGGTKARSKCTGAAAVRSTGPRVAIAIGGINPAAARWNKLCWQAARSPPSAPAAGSRGLAPTAFKMPPLSGLSSQHDHSLAAACFKRPRCQIVYT